jgi:ABC-type lipoprotein release transport system permease subunit
MTLLRIAWRNLGRRKVRTGLTAGATVFAVVISILNLSIGAGSHERWVEQAVRLYPGHIEVSAAGYREQRSLDYGMTLAPEQLALLDGLGGHVGWAPRLEAWALAIPDRDDSVGRPVQLIGIDPAREARLSRLRSLLVAGSFLEHAGENEVVLGSGLLRNLGIALGEQLILLSTDRYGSQSAARFRVVGELASGDAQLDGYLALARIDDLRGFLEFPGGLSHVALFVDSSERVEPLVRELDVRFDGERYEVVPWPELLPDLVQLMLLDDVGNWVGNAILIVVVAFGLLNTVLMSVMERVREFGVMRALGLRPWALFRLVLLESALLGGLGIALGAALAIPFVLWLEGNPIPLSVLTEAADEVSSLFGIEASIQFRLTPEQWLGIPLLILAIALLAAVPAALRAMRGRPVDALRTV